MRIRTETVGIFLLLSIATFSTPAFAQGRRQAQPGKEPPHPPKVGEQAPDFELKTLGGDIVSLEKLTEDSPVVILVLRGWPGYQCPICNRQVGEFLNKQSDFADVQLVMIYPGPADLLAEHAKEFQGAKSFPDNFHYVIDPDYKFTNAWGLRWEATRETAYPSTFVIGRDRKILFGQTVVSHRDRVNASTVLEVLAKPEP
ncbi:peroxiredoxin [Rhodopirellula rubra]|uniref:Peroxiredoxin n=1 Tax=Aporhodopirellula rubra TaxID=980271 RepID=A0A7W5H595_9BACT|nr:peroxiredoxin-like family protein [Aporhodopirellula rubra]MBB3206018.1 peroxiredoxin [Aporhodopirellula rubra]